MGLYELLYHSSSPLTNKVSLSSQLYRYKVSTFSFRTASDVLYLVWYILWRVKSSRHGLQRYDFEKRKALSKRWPGTHIGVNIQLSSFAQFQARMNSLPLGDIYIGERDIESVIRIHTQTISLRFSVCIWKWHKIKLEGSKPLWCHVGEELHN